MELLIALVIIGVLASVVGPVLVQRLQPAKRTAAREQIEHFMTALDHYFVDTGRFPTAEDGLRALRERPGGEPKWKGPYLKKEIPKDPWGGAYVYRSPGRNGGYEIVSWGADRKEGGAGEDRDVASWENEQD